jgi:hypothetical protein
MSYVQVNVLLNDSQKSIIKNAITMVTDFVIKLTSGQVADAIIENDKVIDTVALFFTNRQYLEFLKAKGGNNAYLATFHKFQLAAISKYNYDKEIEFDPVHLRKRTIINRSQSVSANKK